MNSATTAKRERPVVIAGLMGVTGLATALVYAFYSTPYTMVLFMGVGLSLLVAAAAMFALAILREVRGRMTSLGQREFAAGEVILRQGDHADFVYVITAGEVEFLATGEDGAEIPLGTLGVSDHFGDIAVLNGTTIQATARAADDVALLAIHKHDFRSLYTHLPNLRQRIEAEQERRTAIVEHRLGRNSD